MLSRNCALQSEANVVIDFRAGLKKMRRALFGGRPCQHHVTLAIEQADRMTREAKALTADLKLMRDNEADPFEAMVRNFRRARR